MSPRERVFRTLNRQPVDRMPRTLDVGASAGIDASYLDVFHANTDAQMPAEYFNYDIRIVEAPLTKPDADFSIYYGELPSGTTFDEFGVAHAPSAHFPLGHYFHPWQDFSSVRQVFDYPFPAFVSDVDLPKTARRLRDNGYATSAAAGSINEWCYYLRGMEGFLTDLLVHPEMAEATLDRVTALTESMGIQLAEAGVDILCFYGDMGEQHTLLMNPDLWGRWIKPRWQRVFDSARRVRSDVVIFYHSCGYIEPIISDLIELGVDILNPVQPESMDPFHIKRKYGHNISLWGGVGMQQTMLSPDTASVRKTVQSLVKAWQDGGGGIVTAAQTMLPDVPWNNVITLLETVEETSRGEMSATPG